MLLRVTAIIPAAGSGSRMGPSAVRKQYLKILGKPMIEWTLSVIGASPRIDEIILVVPQEDVESVRARYRENSAFPKVKSVVAGGARRCDSVYNGLKVASNEWVLLHDAARPFVTSRLIELVINAAQKHTAATAALSVRDTVKTRQGGFVGDTVDRESLLLVQTPQLFAKKKLMEAFKIVKDKNADWTDETSILKSAGMKVAWVQGERTNIKITDSEDIPFATALAKLTLEVSNRCRSR